MTSSLRPTGQDQERFLALSRRYFFEARIEHDPEGRGRVRARWPDPQRDGPAQARRADRPSGAPARG